MTGAAERLLAAGSVLARADAGCVRVVPFPHLVIENALERQVYEALAETFPGPVSFLRGLNPESNRYYWLEARETLGGHPIGRLWREFVRYHTSREFFGDVLRVFEPAILDLYPALEEDLPLSRWSTGVRHLDTGCRVALECQLTYCAPVQGEPSRPRGPHVDREVALFGGLLYMRHPEDDSQGGDLVIHEVRAGAEPTFDAANHVDDELLYNSLVVRYRPNTLVFFINSPRSIHSVTARSETRFPRLHVNFVGELAQPLFVISKPRTASTKANAWYGNRNDR